MFDLDNESVHDIEELEFLRILRNQEKFNGKTEIQKKFLFFEKRGFYLMNLKHFYYLRGPYSSKLTYLVESSIEKGFLIRQRDISRNCTVYIPNKRRIDDYLHKNNYTKFLSLDEKASLKEINLLFMGLKNSKDRELVGTVFSIIHSDKHFNKKAAYSRLKELKEDKFSEEKFIGAWKLLEYFNMIQPKEEKIILCGCDDVQWLMENLYQKIENSKCKVSPIWFHRYFPVANIDTMKQCLLNVRNADRAIFILNQRYGLYYQSSRFSILEEEFNLAFKLKKPILIFIPYQTYKEAKTYHHLKKEGLLNLHYDFTNLGFKADRELYEFIERIQHKVDNGGFRRIIWIEAFNSIDDILGQIKYKWNFDLNHW